MAKRPAGYIIDVPVALTVTVRGEGLSEERAISIAETFSAAIEPSDWFIKGYVEQLRKEGLLSPSEVISEVYLSGNSEESSDVIDELEADDDGDDDA